MQKGQYNSRRVRRIPVLMRPAWWFVGLSFIIPAVSFTAAWLLFPVFGISYAYIGAAAFTLIPAQLVGALLWIPTQRRLVRLARETGGLVCIYCGYDLAGRATPDVCPECGRALSDDDAREAWGTLIGNG